MLRAEPIFFRSLTRGMGSRRTAFTVENLSERPLSLCLLALRDCPDWLNLERVGPDGRALPLVPLPGAAHVPEAERAGHPCWLVLPPRRRLELIANVNTSHRWFPRGAEESGEALEVLRDEATTIQAELSEGQRLEIPLSIAEVRLQRPAFQGTFALDLGTTHCCYAWKRHRVEPAGLERPPTCSAEVPSAIYYRDLRSAGQPRTLVGARARLALVAHPDRVYAYAEGIKRRLGQATRLTFLDARGRGASYRPEDVAAHLVRPLLEQAEAEDLGGERIERVVVTYPTLFTPRQRAALQEAVLLALHELDPARVPERCLLPGPHDPAIQAERDARVELRLDEASAATFRYVTGPLLEACLRFGRPQAADVLAFDFGGGTIDVAVLRVRARRDPEQRAVRLESRVLGVGGEPYYGGDNVTLELVRLLRAKLAVTAAAAILEQAGQGSTSRARAREGLDIFDRILEGQAGPAEAGADEPGAEGALPREQRLAWARLLHHHGEGVVEAVLRGQEHPLAGEDGDPFLEHLRDLLQERAQGEGRPFRREEADAVLEALEGLIPTRFARYADLDPLLERRSKGFFLDLWREAHDRLKPTLVARCADPLDPAAAAAATCPVQEPLERLARWVGVDPKLWNDRVVISLAELERLVAPRIEAAVDRAKALYLGALDEEEPSAGEGEPPLVTTRRTRRLAGVEGPGNRLTVVLSGNASALPLVRRRFAEVLRGLDHELVWDERTRKTSVVQGAVEERLLAQAYGAQGGGVHYERDDPGARLPFSLGFYERFVGFRPFLPRGTPVGAQVTLSAREHELIGPDRSELTLYADFHDGAPPRFLGALDLRARQGRPATPEELSRLRTPEGDYRLGVRLLPDWELDLIEPQGSWAHRVRLEPPRPGPREDPFSGVH